MKICHLYISAGHNYFGNRGTTPGSFPTMEVAAVECVAGRGLRGDRFFDYKQNYQGQVTFFSWEIHERLARELPTDGRSPAGYRRNVISEGVDLNELIGVEFEVQGVRFLGRAECTPCRWMDFAYGHGAEKFLHGQGGLRAVILTDGILRADGVA